jgi:hypothetical protein
MQSHQQHHKTMLHEPNSLVCLVYLRYKKKYLSKLQYLSYLALLNACHNHKALL